MADESAQSYQVPISIPAPFLPLAADERDAPVCEDGSSNYYTWDKNALPIDEDGNAIPQEKLHLYGHKRRRFMVYYGGRGCVHPDTLIDTPNGQIKISEFNGGDVFAWHDGKIIITQATPSKSYDEQQLYKVTLENGRSISVTDHHKFLTQRGWVRCCELSLCDSIVFAQQSCLSSPQVSVYHHPSNSDIDLLGSRADVRHLTNKDQDSQVHYLTDYHQDDVQPQLAKENDQFFSPLQDDERQHNRHALLHEDDLECEDKNIPLQSLCRLSIHDDAHAMELQNFEVMENYSDDKLSAPLLQSTQQSLQFREKKTLEMQDQEFSSFVLDYDFQKNQAQNHQTETCKQECAADDIPCKLLSCYHDTPILSKINSICKHDRLVYWDLHVPYYENYLSNGIVNHNSGKSDNFALIALLKHALVKPYIILACRETYTSIRDSMYQTFRDWIEKLNLESQFEFTEHEIRSRPTGGKIIFRGLKTNASEVKSLKNIGLVIVDEALQVSRESWNFLIPTIRLEKSEIWVAYNTGTLDDYTHKRFAIDPDDRTYTFKINITENPLAPKILLEEMDAARKRAEKTGQWDEFNNVWLGEPLTAVDGGIFKPENIKIVPAAPVCVRWVRGWDLASSAVSSKNPDPDFSVGVKMGVTSDGIYVIADIIRIRDTSDVVECTITNTASQDGTHTAISIAQDPGGAGKFQSQYLVRKLSGYTVHTSPESGNKAVRAGPLSSQVNVGNVCLVAGMWNEAFINEMRSFNGEGKQHDDQIDAASRSFSYLQTPYIAQMISIRGL